MQVKTFKYYQDAGHGWVAVKRQLLHDLGIADKISPYSYQKGKTVYLEEDCDASTFFNAYILKYGKDSYYTKTTDNRWPDRSPIRSYENYSNNQ